MNGICAYSFSLYSQCRYIVPQQQINMFDYRVLSQYYIQFMHSVNILNSEKLDFKNHPSALAWTREWRPVTVRSHRQVINMDVTRSNVPPKEMTLAEVQWIGRSQRSQSGSPGSDPWQYDSIACILNYSDWLSSIKMIINTQQYV